MEVEDSDFINDNGIMYKLTSDHIAIIIAIWRNRHEDGEYG